MIQQRIIQFQLDIQKGMSIDSALKKHNLSLKETTEILSKKRSRKKKKKTPKQKSAAKYISQRGNSYYLRKTIDGKIKMFGTYSSLEDAITVRDYCMANGWKQRKIDEICGKLGVERIKHQKNTVRYR